MHAVLLAVLFSFSLTSWAQILAPPPTSFPDASTTPAPTTSLTTTRASVSTVTTPRPSGSASLPVSGNATQTSSAQFPSLSGYSSCVSQCLAKAVSAANCTSLVDVNCFCPSGVFTLNYVNCLSANCPPDLTSAESLAQQFCNLSNSTSTSLSFPSVPPTATTTATTTSVLVTSASTASGSTGTGSSGASNTAFSVGADAMGMRFGLLMTTLGVVLGAYLVD